MPPLHDVSVLIVDCQTTGATPALGAVLELGWCVVTPARGDLHLQSHRIALPAGQRVSTHVRRLTGYDETWASYAIAPDEAWRRLRACMASQPMPAAIHFARFELGFLHDWAERFEPEAAFPFTTVCVHAIARRLYPELPRRSLRALAGHLGHSLDLTRHAVGHVAATAFIWRKLTPDLAALGIHTWAELETWLAQPEPRLARSPKRRYPLPSERYKTLPDQPGVYQFTRSNGDVLYIGKAASLKKRVTSHFAVRSSREHSIEMLTQVSDIQVTLTDSALEAALLENERIKALRPPYNLQLTGYDQRAWFAARGFDAASTVPDREHRIGPLPSQFSLRALSALMTLARDVPPDRSSRARSVGAAERWAPDEAVFASGFAAFAAEHGLRRGTSPGAARQAVLTAAKRLLAIERSDTQPSDDSTEGTLAASADSAHVDAPPRWDPERVARHLARALLQSYPLLRRAMWLALIENSAVTYREPGSTRTRLLILEDGAIISFADARKPAGCTRLRDPDGVRGRIRWSEPCMTDCASSRASSSASAATAAPWRSTSRRLDASALGSSTESLLRSEAPCHPRPPDTRGVTARG